MRVRRRFGAVFGTMAMAMAVFGIVGVQDAGATSPAPSANTSSNSAGRSSAASSKARAPKPTKFSTNVGVVLPMTINLTGIIAGDALVTQVEKPSGWSTVGSQALKAGQTQSVTYIIASSVGTYTIQFRIDRNKSIIGSGAPSIIKVKKGPALPKFKLPRPGLTPPGAPKAQGNSASQRTTRPLDQPYGSIGTYQTKVGCGGGDPNSLAKNGYPESAVVAPFATPEAGLSGQYIEFNWYSWVWTNTGWVGSFLGGSEIAFVQSNPDINNYVNIGSGIDAANLPTLGAQWTSSGEYHYIAGIYGWYSPTTGALDGSVETYVNSYTQFDLYDNNVTLNSPYCYTFSNTIG